MLFVLVFVVLVLIAVGGLRYDDGRYRSGGIGLGTLLLVILIVWLLLGVPR